MLKFQMERKELLQTNLEGFSSNLHIVRISDLEPDLMHRRHKSKTNKIS